MTYDQLRRQQCKTVQTASVVNNIQQDLTVDMGRAFAEPH